DQGAYVVLQQIIQWSGCFQGNLKCEVLIDGITRVCRLALMSRPGRNRDSWSYPGRLDRRPFVADPNRSLLVVGAPRHIDNNPAHLEPVRQEAGPQQRLVVPSCLIDMSANNH